MKKTLFYIMSLVIAINSLGVNAKSNKLCEKSKSQNSIIQAIKNKKDELLSKENVKRTALGIGGIVTGGLLIASGVSVNYYEKHYADIDNNLKAIHWKDNLCWLISSLLYNYYTYNHAVHNSFACLENEEELKKIKNIMDELYDKSHKNNINVDKSKIQNVKENSDSGEVEIIDDMPKSGNEFEELKNTMDKAYNTSQENSTVKVQNVEESSDLCGVEIIDDMPKSGNKNESKLELCKMIYDIFEKINNSEDCIVDLDNNTIDKFIKCYKSCNGGKAERGKYCSYIGDHIESIISNVYKIIEKEDIKKSEIFEATPLCIDNFIEKHLYLGLKVNDNYYTIGKCANRFYSGDAVAIKKVSKECFDREIKYSKKELGNKIKDI